MEQLGFLYEGRERIDSNRQCVGSFFRIDEVGQGKAPGEREARLRTRVEINPRPRFKNRTWGTLRAYSDPDE